MTIQVTDSYTVQQGDTLQFQNEPAFNLVAGSGRKGGELFIDGRVEVSGGAAPLVGITSETGTGETLVNIGKTGVLTVSGAGDVIGLQAHARMVLLNYGDVTVSSSAGTAVGYQWDHSPSSIRGSFENRGHFAVSGATEAYGAVYETRASISTGDMDVTSGGKAVGVQFQVSGQFLCDTLSVSGVGEAVGCSFGSSGRDSGPDATVYGELVVTATGHGSTGVGIEFTSPYTAGQVFNRGLIQAQTAVLDHSTEGGSGLTVRNYAKIYGDILLGAGDDRIENTGVVRGDIHMGAGADAYLSQSDGGAALYGVGALNGMAYGGDGADTLVGGNRADVLYGDEAGASTARGADRLIGNLGDDSLYGGASADTLDGGAGGDRLSGGGGADRFVFTAVTDSAPGAADHIVDLSNADLIDLSGIDADTTMDGDQAFTLVKALDGHAGEAALVYSKADRQTVLQLDVDGDGTADATVLIDGKHADFTGFAL